MLITFTLSHIYCEVVKRVGSILIDLISNQIPMSNENNR